MRTPAYEPGPKPITMRSGTPCCRTACCKDSKKADELFLSLGQARFIAGAALPSETGSWVKYARLPWLVDNSIASVVIQRRSTGGRMVAFRIGSSVPLVACNHQIDPPIRSHKHRLRTDNRPSLTESAVPDLRFERNQNDKSANGLPRT